MRRWLLVLMIALLPVRGWVGDAMASEMAGAQLNAINSIVAHADSTRATAGFATQSGAESHADCHGQAALAAAPDDAAQPLEHSTQDCGSCTACQVCHTVALAAPDASATPVQRHHGTPPAAGQPFASAVLARGFKPPIS